MCFARRSETFGGYYCSSWARGDGDQRSGYCFLKEYCVSLTLVIRICRLFDRGILRLDWEIGRIPKTVEGDWRMQCKTGMKSFAEDSSTNIHPIPWNAFSAISEERLLYPLSSDKFQRSILS